MDQGTATGDIAAGDPPSDLASSVPALILPTPDGPDPPNLTSSVPALILPIRYSLDSDIASSVPALSLSTPDGPALSDPTPDGPALSNPTPVDTHTNMGLNWESTSYK